MGGMTKRPTTLEELNAYCSALEQQNAELMQRLQWLEEQFRLAQKRRFGSSSERTDPDQVKFVFNELEAEAEPSVPEPELLTILTHKRKKTRRTRNATFEGLEVEEIHYTLPADEQACPQCNGALHEMSTQVREELKFIPAQVKVVRRVQHVYSCRHCQHADISTPVITAPAPKPPVPGSYASASVIAHVIDAKFVDGMPLYRQEQKWSRLGVQLSRQTLSNWTLEAAERNLAPIYERMRFKLLRSDIVHADETTVQVLHEPGRESETKSYMWLYRTGGNDPPIVLFDYQQTRAAEHPKTFLSGFSGYLQVDGYVGYESIPNVTLVGCWSHARRGFDEAITALPQDLRSDKSTAAHEGLNYCNLLFQIEGKLKELTPSERQEKRLLLSVPVLSKFHSWLRTQKAAVLPKTTLGKAVNYCWNQWEKLQSFLLDGRLEIDNNRAERSIKPFVMGRKNWLFSNTPRGARVSAILYSIVETAKENRLKPFDYISHLLEQVPGMDMRDPELLDTLLPWSESLPDTCKTPVRG